MEKKRFLFVSEEALVGDLAWQVKKEGNEVKYYIGEKASRDICNGFVDKCDDYKALKDWADVIVFDDVFYGEEADKLRKEGKAVVGGSVYTDRLEEDREFGQDELKKVGINVLPHWDFTDFDEAVKFVTKTPGRYVLKPTSKTGEKELLFVGQEEDGKDVIQLLEHYKKEWSKKIKFFQIQKYVAGVEIAVGAFFNGVDFITPINVNFENKRMFPGDLGPSTGEMGTHMYWAPSNTIFVETLAKMKPALAQAGYVGYIDLNCIVNSKGIHPLEFTSRFGYPTISIQLEGITSPVGEFLHAIANHKPYELKTKKGFQVGIVVACPPFPFYDMAAFKKYAEDATVLFKKPNTDGVHIGDVKLVDGDWLLAGYSGYCLVVTGHGSTMEDARKQAYSRVENIMIPNMFYRTDIGGRWFADSDRLHTWGYLS